MYVYIWLNIHLYGYADMWWGSMLHCQSIRAFAIPTIQISAISKPVNDFHISGELDTQKNLLKIYWKIYWKFTQSNKKISCCRQENGFSIQIHRTMKQRKSKLHKLDVG